MKEAPLLKQPSGLHSPEGARADPEALPCYDLLRDALVREGLRVHDPATGRHIATVRDWPDADINSAIERAENARSAWSSRTARERARILEDWFDLIIARAEDLAQLLTLEQGKPIAEARGEIAYGASFVEWFAQEARRIYGEVIPANQADQRLFVIRQPIGVVAAITPWNFPVAMITRKLGPALAAGCPVIVKPAEATPLCALALAQLAWRAGVPRDCLTVATGTDPARIGRILCRSHEIRKVSFTGSTVVGKTLMEWCAPTVKRLSLELGGNAPFIVFDDADLDVAIDAAMLAKFRNAGQTCVCANRLLVQDGIYDRFLSAFRARVAALKVGPGEQPDTQIGPVIDARAATRIASLIADARDHGAQIHGGEPIAGDGHFVEPAIIAPATRDMRLAQEEIFGPVAAIFRFSTEDEAIAIANDTQSGLAAYLFTRDLARTWRVGEALESGMVGVNTAAISNEVAPFGGIKESGLGREGSRHGIEDYLEMKYLCLGQMN